MNAKSRMLLGLSVAMLMIGSTGVARDATRQRGTHPPRPTQPHTRITETRRTETGRVRRDTWTGANGTTAMREAEVIRDRDTGTRSRSVDYTAPRGTVSVDSMRAKTDDGFTRSTTVINSQGETATRDLTVTRDKESDTLTREANYSPFDGRSGSMSDVIQRTDEGISRVTTSTTPDGATHTRRVEMSCDKDVGKCVKQVEVGHEP